MSSFGSASKTSTSIRMYSPSKRASPSSILRLEKLRVDGAGVNVEKRRVVVKDLVKENDELHQVGISLLPERLLATPEQVI